MSSFKRTTNIVGWLVFAVATVVYYLSAERTGSLWDCGEFILGAHKLQVVHPPGAPLFLLVGRMFAWAGSIFSSNPENIAFAVNLMSGICTAFAAMFVAWVAIILGKLALVGRDGEPGSGDQIALAAAGLVAGLGTAFCTSIWFSAVEGEVYAMSTFFTALTLWATVKWYALPDDHQNDRWLIFAVYMAGLSIGVHLLSILTFPALAMFFYFKRSKNVTFLGTGIAAFVGVVIVGLVQMFIITGLPRLWANFELLFVNTFGLPFHSGIIPTVLIILAAIYFGLRYAHKNQESTVQNVVVAFALMVLAMSTYGMVVTRANSNPPINMNAPKDALSLLPYLNREQYGDRPLLRGPHFAAQPTDVTTEKRYGRVGDRYEHVSDKVDYVYNDADKMFFPRMADPSQGRPSLYMQWMGMDPNQQLPEGWKPTQGQNFGFFWNYQIKWMYWRYFMWNFAGRQNGEQGLYPWDKSAGHWLSGIAPLDNARLGNQALLPEVQKNNAARNKYYLLPFIFGLLGVVYHFGKRRNDFLGLLALFVITGLGIIVYSNQPPNEPRERDYVLAGSFFVYCIWMGMAVLAIYELLRDRVKLSGPVGAGLAGALVIIAPILMGTQNFDDHSRNGHYASRDYASNFLNSVEKNAVIFTYGDNDTYPLWYAQEVEGIRRDVRVVNLSLIAVDWYIDLLRRKINDSPALKLTLSSSAYQGDRRNQMFFVEQGSQGEMSAQDFMRFVGEDHPQQLSNGGSTESYLPTRSVYLPVPKAKVIQMGLAKAGDSTLVDRIPLKMPAQQYMTKDDIAVLDVITSNLWDRPIYFAVTTQASKFFGLDDYMELEGLALRIVPTRTTSDPNYGLIGSGKVDADRVYENVMKKWRWGNFDKEPTFVDNSYAPSLQSMQLVMRRAAGAFLAEGKNDKAIALTDQYFKSFPHFNFPYDYRTNYMLEIYVRAGAYKKAKPHMEILAKETLEQLRFINSQDPDVITSSYDLQKRLAEQTIETLLRDAKENKDQKFVDDLTKKFAPFKAAPTENSLFQQPQGQ
ncbi:MAG: DUF2723 domain-containing protein [Haliscomenobacter sp.]|uniref:glycosyltransferase family 117 protein n=1 Tax=Haliscomenobacter sp. TaxID=2717303 RepID=UPI0029B36198|nr:DUF2723 domain-containing protein [Haliscomenobacter sp.]MDX2068000.1 DUF2723 domain-containing protein [Haliscomenobacter sp.]